MKSLINSYSDRVNQRLDSCLPIADGPAESLFEAMRYSVFNGGKRIRPLLCFAAADAVGKVS